MSDYLIFFFIFFFHEALTENLKNLKSFDNFLNAQGHHFKISSSTSGGKCLCKV